MTLVLEESINAEQSTCNPSMDVKQIDDTGNCFPKYF